MKRLFSILFFAVTVLTSFAQTTSDASQHLSFKGVPIDGTLDGFVAQMKKGGFTLARTGDGIAFLEGDFASYKSCMVTVSTLKTKDLVSHIAVLFPDCDTWSSLYSNYINLKDLLTEKYGKPSGVVEKFETRAYEPDDNQKMHEIKFDRCKYYTVYETAKGSIQLSIEHESVTRCFVQLVYMDKINSETVKKQALHDL